MVVEGDAGRRAFAHAPQNKILANFAATPNAAIAEDASGEIDADAHRRFVNAAPRVQRSVARCQPTILFGQSFELTVAGLAFARARTRMVGHEQLDERAASLLHLF